MTQSIHASSEAAIWERMFQHEHAMLTDEAARYFLDLVFAEADRKRMHTLIQRRQNDELTAEEEAELHAYRQVGFQIDLLKSKARQTLGVAPEPSELH